MAPEEVHPVVQSIFTDEDVTIMTIELAETVLLGIANALRDENAVAKELHFSSKGISSGGLSLSSHVAQAFRDSLKINTSLRKITFQYIQKSEILSTLLTGVAGSQSIEHLSFHCRPLCAQDLLSVVETFRRNPNLDTLSIDSFSSPDEAATVLANALADGSLRHLKHLLLDWCCISSKGASEIARGLKQNCNTDYVNVETLGLLNNPIGDIGALALADALSKHNNNKHKQSQLKKLELSQCGLTSAGAIALAGMLEENNRLERLILYSNRGIQKEGGDALDRAMSHNTCLVSLGMRKMENINQQRLEHSLEINRFRKKYLEQDHSNISPYLYPRIFAQVSIKPSMLFLFLQETTDMFIPYLVPDPF
jgi:hypothetical protein